MPEYELRLRFTAADDHQADRLADAWADTCAAEYSTRFAGWVRLPDDRAYGGVMNANEKLMCASMGHEDVPAYYVGVYEDDREYPNTPYCRACANSMIRTGEYRVTRTIGKQTYPTTEETPNG